MKKITIPFILMSLLSCGYKPTSHSIKNIFGESIYVDVRIDKVEPKSAVYIKDEMRKFIYTRFHSKIEDLNHADSSIIISYSDSKLTPLKYDRNGFVREYTITLPIIFKVKTKNGKIFTKKIRSKYESDTYEIGKNQSYLRAEAIERAMKIAIDEFVAYLSRRGLK